MSTTSLRQAPSERPVGSKPVAELILSGDVDMEVAHELQSYLIGGLERGCDIVIDLAGVRLIDCACLDVLVRAAQVADSMNSLISLVSPSELVRMTLRVTETDALFLVRDDPAVAPRRGAAG